MKFNILNTVCALCLAMGIIVPNTASAVTYQLSWIGSNGYTLAGLFSYDDSFIDTGIVDETVLNTFMIEGFHNGASLGSWNFMDESYLADGSLNPLEFNFNFNSTTDQFIVGNTGQSLKGQSWNRRATGLGFESGDNHQTLTLDGMALGSEAWINTADSTLTATVVPVPAAIYLFASGLLGLFGISRRESHKRRL